MALFNIFRKGSSSFMSSILNVLGMAVAFAAFYIILVQVDYDLNFNKGIKDSEKVFVLSVDAQGQAKYNTLYYCRPLAEKLMQSSPNIEFGGVINLTNTAPESFWTDRNGEKEVLSLRHTDISGTALMAIGFEAVEGSLDDVINRNTLAVSESAANRFDLKVGMSLGQGTDMRTIVAVFKDMPDNSHFKNLDLLSDMGDRSLDNFTEWGFTHFVKLHDPSQVEQMEKELAEVARSYYMERFFGTMPSPEELGMTQEEFDKEVNDMLNMAIADFIPIESLYYDNAQLERGNKTTTIILLIVGILILSIAFINYINFFFAQIPERIRAVNTKKVLGCTRRELIISTVTESMTLILFALVLAFAFVMLFNMSQLTHLISADSNFSTNIGVTMLTVAIAIVISIVSSLYPAYYITSFEPALVLKGSFSGTKSGQRLRYILVGLQFVISSVLIICSGFINIQRDYMIDFDMGFDKEQLLYVHTTNYIGYNAEAVEERLKTDPQIADVTWAAGDLIAEERMGWGRQWNGQNINFECYPVAYDFPEFMGIDIIEGRTFSPEDKHSETGVFIFNDAARRKYGFTLEDKVSGHMTETDIVGFCEDFSFQSLKHEVRPFALYIFGTDPWWYPTTAFIRVSAGADYQAVMKHIASVMSEWEYNVSPDEWNIHFFDDNINATYRKEKALSDLISLFTLIAIIISLMGVFGLVMFETQYRRREIALRRVNGATVKEILAMFCSRFVKIVLVCFAAAAPVSWVIVNRYLATFAHRCPMYWWVFALALVAVMAVTIGVVVLRSCKAATADPANALKTE
ncbi:MAG: hypothetical protein IKY16_06405 [Bacteroidales bacterium]|nr:hypothetical protein [Bacteroidales bacterium]